MQQRSTVVFMNLRLHLPTVALILISCSPQTPSQTAGVVWKRIANPSDVEVGGGGRCLVGVD